MIEPERSSPAWSCPEITLGNGRQPHAPGLIDHRLFCALAPSVFAVMGLVIGDGSASPAGDLALLKALGCPWWPWPRLVVIPCSSSSLQQGRFPAVW